MAKRKRLTPANPAIFGTQPPVGQPRAPIADIAADASTVAALNQLSQEMSEARQSGRMVVSLTVDQIQMDHLVRDRIAVQDADMQALVQSIKTRGQQTPIEVMELSPGHYGLISGWRRCQAIAQLAQGGLHDGQVLALLRRPDTASDAYLAMVEENEIRVGLSYYERARIAAKSVQQGVFGTDKAALLSLFQTASRAKRSKIRSFLPLVAAFDGVLAFPHAIGERLGLRMSAALEVDAGFAAAVAAAVSARPAATAEAEQACIEGVLEGQKTPAKKQAVKVGQDAIALRSDVTARWSQKDGLVLSGAGLTAELRDQICDFIKQQPKGM